MSKAGHEKFIQSSSAIITDRERVGVLSLPVRGVRALLSCRWLQPENVAVRFSALMAGLGRRSKSDRRPEFNLNPAAQAVESAALFNSDESFGLKGNY